jgi:hypothetical protein
MVATLRPAFINATAICMAMVDLPEPPFSLATTMMRAGGAELSASNDMGILQCLGEDRGDLCDDKN